MRDAFHGGRAFETIGHGLEYLDRRKTVVPADVLDAWFDPCPSAMEVINSETTWLVRTAPPETSLGLAKALAVARKFDDESVLCGAGSSDLIYRAFLSWLSRDSRVFVFDPTYSEYRHLCENVIGCRVDSMSSLDQSNEKYDLIVVVNPNNPTGEIYSRAAILNLRSKLRSGGRIWVDEAYMPFVANGESLQQKACDAIDLVVCQSLSKSLALSGLRVGYLVGHPNVLRSLRQRTPPWVVGLPAIAATMEAIHDPGYYAEKYFQTTVLRTQLSSALCDIEGLTVVSGSANWLSCRSEKSGQAVTSHCEHQGVMIRTGIGMFLDPPSGFLRVAVRSEEENARIVDAVASAHTSAAVV